MLGLPFACRLVQRGRLKLFARLVDSLVRVLKKHLQLVNISVDGREPDDIHRPVNRMRVLVEKALIILKQIRNDFLLAFLCIIGRILEHS